MRKIRIEKVTLNIGSGKDQDLLIKGLKLLGNITGSKPIKNVTRKRIPTWGIRPGLPIGCKVTLRGGKAADTLKRLLNAKENKLKSSNFDGKGSISFGIPEYIDIPDIRYDPEIGIIGLQVCVTLERPGFRIKKRSLLQKKLPSKHLISRDDSIEFLKNEFKTEVVE